MMTVPRYTQELKNIVDELSALFVTRADFKDKIRDAKQYFSKDRSKREIVNGVATLFKYIESMESIDLNIRDLQAKFVIIIEEAHADLKFDMIIDAHEGENGEPIDRRTLSFGNEGVDITPEQVWFLQISKKLFKTEPSNVRIP